MFSLRGKCANGDERDSKAEHIFVRRYESFLVPLNNDAATCTLTLLTNCATSTFTSPGTYLATSLGFSPGSTQHTECKSVVTKLYKVFTEKECTLVEINPLVETKQGKVQSVISYRIVSPTAHYCLRLRT